MEATILQWDSEAIKKHIDVHAISACISRALFAKTQSPQRTEMEKITKLYKAEIKSVNEKEFTLEAVVTTKKKDRDGDVVLPDAVRGRIKTYRDHPILLSSHDHYRLTAQIGKAENIQINDENVTVRFKYFVGEGNPEADWAWVLGQKGMASFSIGFMAHGFEWIEEKQDDGTMRRTGRKFTDIEFIEISQVLVPSNRGALQLSMQQVETEKELCELVSKAFASGELKEITKQKEQKTTEYDLMLGDGSKDSGRTPKAESVSDVIRSTVSKILNKEKA